MGAKCFILSYSATCLSHHLEVGLRGQTVTRRDFTFCSILEIFQYKNYQIQTKVEVESVPTTKHK